MTDFKQPALEFRKLGLGGLECGIFIGAHVLEEQAGLGCLNGNFLELVPELPALFVNFSALKELPLVRSVSFGQQGGDGFIDFADLLSDSYEIAFAARRSF